MPSAPPKLTRDRGCHPCRSWSYPQTQCSRASNFSGRQSTLNFAIASPHTTHQAFAAATRHIDQPQTCCGAQPLPYATVPRYIRLLYAKSTVCQTARERVIPTDHGERNDGREDSLVHRPTTLRIDTTLFQIRLHICQAIGSATAATVVCGYSCDITEPAVPAIVGGDMGWASESRAEEEGLAHEEETQTDGRKGSQRRHIIMQVPSLWQCQEDAPSVHNLRAQ